MPNKKEKFFSKNSEKQYGEFALSEFSTFLIGFLVFFVLINYFKINYLLSAIAVGFFNIQLSYFLNKKFTFHEKLGKNFLKTYSRFTVIRIFSGLIYIGLLFVFANFVFNDIYLSYIVAILTGGATNFFLNKFFNFEKIVSKF
jgi:putative flippase GtrA